MSQLQGKVVWITGASSGIGEELAYQLATLGCKLILSARRASVLKEVQERCANSENVQILPLDLVDIDMMHAKVTEAIAFFGTIDILINNGGVSQRSLIAETDISVYKALMDVNYLGTVALSKAILPHFIAQQKGHYVTVTSLMGRFGSPYRSGYCGAKHALHGFFDVLRMEHEKDNVAVTLIGPGFVQTNVARNALTADGSKQNTNDKATKKGLPVDVFAKKMIKAIQQQKHEAFIGQKEVMGIYVKRFFPKLLHKLVLRNEVR